MSNVPSLGFQAISESPEQQEKNRRPMKFQSSDDAYWRHPVTARVIRMHLKEKLDLALRLGRKTEEEHQAEISLANGENLTVTDELDGYYMLKTGACSDYLHPEDTREDDPSGITGTSLTIAIVNLLLEHDEKTPTSSAQMKNPYTVPEQARRGDKQHS